MRLSKDDKFVKSKRFKHAKEIKLSQNEMIYSMMFANSV